MINQFVDKLNTKERQDRQLIRELAQINKMIAKIEATEDELANFNRGSNTILAHSLKEDLFVKIYHGLKQEMKDAMRNKRKGGTCATKASTATACIEKCLQIDLVAKARSKSEVEFIKAEGQRSAFDLKRAVLLALQLCFDHAMAPDNVHTKQSKVTGETISSRLPRHLTSLEAKLGELIHTQMKYAEIRRLFPGWWRQVDAYATGGKNGSLRKTTRYWENSIQDSIQKLGGELAKGEIFEELDDETRQKLIAATTYDPWVKEDGKKIRGAKTIVGSWIISGVLKYSGVFETIIKNVNNKQNEFIVLKEDKVEAYAKLITKQCEALVLDQPMVCPPIPNTATQLRGYISEGSHQKPFGYNGRLLISEKHLELANKMQSVPYRLNPFVVAVMERLMEDEIKLGKFCPAYYKAPQSVAERLGYGTLDKEDQDQVIYSDPRFEDTVKERSIDLAKEMARVQSSEAQLTRHLWSAIQGCKGEDYLWFPTCWDFRGRLMFRTGFLQPQGIEPAKAVLQYAIPTKVDKRTKFWLQVELANAAGLDKKSFDDRCAWVENNEDRITQVAQMLETDFCGAISYLEGKDVSDPWLFLAACDEYYHCCIVGDREWTRLRVGVDATCQGAQIMSGWRRSQAAGSKVNILKSDKPSDLYAALWDAVQDIAIHNGFSNTKALKLWKEHGYTRKCGKIVMMSAQYGSGEGCWRNDFLEFHKGLPEDCKLNDSDIAILIDSFAPAIEKVASIAGMVKWCRKVAKATAQKQEAIATAFDQKVAAQRQEQLDKGFEVSEEVPYHRWVLKLPTACGNIVEMTYAKTKTIQIRTFHHGSINVADHKFNLLEETKETDTDGWAKAVTANLVHAADASLLCLALHDWQFNVSTVHDQILSTAGAAMDTLVDRLTTAFVDVCSWDVWSEMMTINGLNPDDTKFAPPVIGDLNISDCKASNYMFC